MHGLKNNICITAAMIMLLTSSNYSTASTLKTDSAKILRCVNSKTGKIEYLGDVRYYVSRDTIFMSRQFSTVSVIYADKKTHKMILKQESYYVNNNKHGWWYTIIKKSSNSPKNAYVSLIVLRNCKDVNESEGRVCWDAHLYNISKEVKRSKTVGTPSLSVQKLLKLL